MKWEAASCEVKKALVDLAISAVDRWSSSTILFFFSCQMIHNLISQTLSIAEGSTGEEELSARRIQFDKKCSSYTPLLAVQLVFIIN
ncbi:hypothetical protein Leryth_002144 [Lithospermum erythrorhizon]|nr:hypothetical protein Leryth_002144 [Lithospermum erythrorhizon]